MIYFRRISFYFLFVFSFWFFSFTSYSFFDGSVSGNYLSSVSSNDFFDFESSIDNSFSSFSSFDSSFSITSSVKRNNTSTPTYFGIYKFDIGTIDNIESITVDFDFSLTTSNRVFQLRTEPTGSTAPFNQIGVALTNNYFIDSTSGHCTLVCSDYISDLRSNVICLYFESYSSVNVASISNFNFVVKYIGDVDPTPTPIDPTPTPTDPTPTPTDPTPTPSTPPPSGSVVETFTLYDSGSLAGMLPASVSGSTPLNLTFIIPGCDVDLPDDATNVRVSLSVRNNASDSFYSASGSDSSTVTVSCFSTLSCNGLSNIESSSFNLQKLLQGTAYTIWPTVSLTNINTIPSSATINFRTTTTSSPGTLSIFSSRDFNIYYYYTVKYDIVTDVNEYNFYNSVSVSSDNYSTDFRIVTEASNISSGYYYLDMFLYNVVGASFDSSSAFLLPFNSSSYSDVLTCVFSDNLSLGTSGMYISGYLYISDDFDGNFFFHVIPQSGILNLKEGWYSSVIYFSLRSSPGSESIYDSLVSAGGANSGFNNQNSKVNDALHSYQEDTDTSSQYGNITDDLFVLDTSIFTNVASTITLFSSCINSIFSALGDLSTVLIMFLVLSFVSVVIGIMHFRG